MEIKHSEIFKPEIEVLSITEFIDKYNPGITTQAVDYAMKHDNIDFTWIGTDRYVVMTKKTRAYKPNESSTRDAKPGKTQTSTMRL
jgi:hypothetical protein